MSADIACPSCSRRLRVTEELVGQLVKCPSCETTFIASLEEQRPPAAQPRPLGAEPPPPPPRSARRPDQEETRAPSRSGRDRDWQEDEDYPYRPGAEGDPQTLVKGPAISLIIVGILG